MSTNGDPTPRDREPLVDELGPIPTFPLAEFDEHGRIPPISPEEKKARVEAITRMFVAMAKLPDIDPPGTDEAMMRGIDEERRRVGRPPAFEGYY
jgi:hypothetical protein